MLNHPDRLFPADPNVRAIARALFETVEQLPIGQARNDKRFRFGTDGPALLLPVSASPQ